jgi:hypothetical protein
VGLTSPALYRRRWRMKRYLAALLVVLGLAGIVGVLAGGRGVADAENASRAKCSEATLDGTYLFADQGFVIRDNEKVPFAASGYEVYDGKGHVKGVVTTNVNGKITSKETFSGTYTVKANCTGSSTYTDGTRYDDFVAPDGSMLTFVQTKPSNWVLAGDEHQVTAKRVGD